MRSAALAIAFLAAPAVVHAQEAPPLPGAGMPSGMAMSPAANRAAPAASDRGPETLPNLAEREGWPQPTADSANYGYFLADLLEYRESDDPGVIRWDVFGWYGGDVKRLWVKSEGAQSTSKRADSEQEAQLLYGQLIAPFFDFQAGVRYARRSGPGPDRSRVYGVIGVQGLAPYRYELEPALFVGQDGKVSARVTASYDVLLSQRLILQPRIEANAALRADRSFGVGKGLNDTEIGARLRYELRRELAPYAGVSWRQAYGSTKRMARAEGEPASNLSVVVGVRAWF
ncbi:copper resistance protein B [Phenylobacterium sp. J426]|uniref:copper resistance protein B n=1 Tax=Phenylobacterium sp. J426 TaxID=2898439 RepID=UPI0021514BDF|nr:copper resistance protein B [Phenylobacterium sp. J426]MCR5873153.1 copper resistance protein B [Phenylobacterium sp. J426]